MLDVIVPGTTGFSTQTQNLGKMYNKGVEVVLNSNNLVGQFTWNTSVNFAYNKNQITDLGGQVVEGSFLNVAMEGQPIGVFYGREFAGADPENGDALYVKNSAKSDGSLDKTTTNDYNAADKVVLGNPTPKITYGFTNDFAYKGISLSILFQGVYGNQIYNGGGAYMSANASNGFDNQTADQINYWKNPGDKTDIPEPRLFDANGSYSSSRYLSPGSYLRLKTATLSYSLPSRLTEKIATDHIRLFITAQNLLTFTKYDGWDPEVDADYIVSNITLGTDFYSVPQSKTFVFGINVGF